jgi:hypothetical protein
VNSVIKSPTYYIPKRRKEVEDAKKISAENDARSKGKSRI